MLTENQMIQHSWCIYAHCSLRKIIHSIQQDLQQIPEKFKFMELSARLNDPHYKVKLLTATRNTTLFRFCLIPTPFLVYPFNSLKILFVQFGTRNPLRQWRRELSKTTPIKQVQRDSQSKQHFIKCILRRATETFSA